MTTDRMPSEEVVSRVLAVVSAASSTHTHDDLRRVVEEHLGDLPDVELLGACMAFTNIVINEIPRAMTRPKERAMSRARIGYLADMLRLSWEERTQ